MELTSVAIDTTENTTVILGQSHFIKTVEDIHEAMVGAVPGIRFGLAFCEASGDRLVRTSGTDEELVAKAAANAMAIGAGHSFVLLLGEGVYGINVLNAVKAVPEVCHVLCCTANPVEVLVAQTPSGRGVVGVVDGASPLGIEDETAQTNRKGLLRMIGYKL